MITQYQFLNILFEYNYYLSIYMLNFINNQVNFTIKHMNNVLALDAKHIEINIIHNNHHLDLILTNDKSQKYVPNIYQMSMILAQFLHIFYFLHPIHKLNINDYLVLLILFHMNLILILNISFEHIPFMCMTRYN